MKEIKIYVVGGDTEYANWINKGVITNNFEEADLILFTGGEDVNPKYYNEKCNVHTHFNDKRDVYEIEYFKKAIEQKKNILGICRGAQLGCVMAGGRLIQHQNNKNYIHKTYITNDNFVDNIYTTSLHHQAQYPFNLSSSNYNIVGYADGHSKFHLDGEGNEMNPKYECEIVYYTKIKCLGIQSHPELQYGSNNNQDKTAIEYFNRLLCNTFNFKIESLNTFGFIHVDEGIEALIHDPGPEPVNGAGATMEDFQDMMNNLADANDLEL